MNCILADVAQSFGIENHVNIAEKEQVIMLTGERAGLKTFSTAEFSAFSEYNNKENSRIAYYRKSLIFVFPIFFS